jgi:hypothetical protein
LFTFSFNYRELGGGIRHANLLWWRGFSWFWGLTGFLGKASRGWAERAGYFRRTDSILMFVEGWSARWGWSGAGEDEGGAGAAA